MGQIQTYADVVAEAAKENALDSIAERLSAQVVPRLEPIKKMPLVYKMVVEDLVPSGIAGFIDYYKKKNKNRWDTANESN